MAHDRGCDLIWSYGFRESEISQYHVSILVQQDVLQLDITIENIELLKEKIHKRTDPCRLTE